MPPRSAPPLDVTVRPLTVADGPFLQSLLRHLVWVPPGAPAPPADVARRAEVARYAAGWGRPGDAGVAAVAEGQPIGAAWVRRWTGDDRGYGFVDAATPELSIGLLPGWRGRGIGTRLLRRVLAVTPDVSLSVSLGNPARRLYEREGFEATGEPAGGSITLARRAGR